MQEVRRPCRSERGERIIAHSPQAQLHKGGVEDAIIVQRVNHPIKLHSQSNQKFYRSLPPFSLLSSVISLAA